MSHWNSALSAAALAAAIMAAPAQAEVLFNNPGTGAPCGAGCWTSGGAPAGSFRTFDNFSISQDAHITSVAWEGFALDDDTNFAELITESWDLGFFADAAGAPGTELYSVNIAPADVSRTFIGSGVAPGGLSVFYYRFAATLPEAFGVAAGETYWFSPFSNQDTFYPLFAWSGSMGGNSYQIQPNGSGIVRTNNRAFALEGQAVPEPATWALMIGGFGLAGGALRRRRLAGSLGGL